MPPASVNRESYEWSINSTKILIDLYRDNPILYDNLNENYRNRKTREAILKEISESITESSGKDCHVADVRKKINGLRTQYLAERSKVAKSLKNGEVYSPSVYWYPLLSFLKNFLNADDSNYDDLDNTHLLDVDETITCPSRRGTKRSFSQSTASEESYFIQEPASTWDVPPGNPPTNIQAFTQFIHSELNEIHKCSGMKYINKAKRLIQEALFRVWDELDDTDLNNECEDS